MRITELLTKETILLDLTSTSKDAVIDELAEKLDAAGKLSDKKLFIKEIHNRESQSSTGIGDGVAIPHAKTKAVKDPAIVFGRSKEGIDYEALDGKKSHLFFMIAASDGANEVHLQALSRLSTLLMDEEFRSTLMEARSISDVLTAVNKKEKEKLDAVEKETATAPSANRPYFVAVTGCPTGIAHTYMAADGLKDKAKELGYDIKVETNGSDGVRNKLTAQDIERADAVIIAADTEVEKARFSGKKLISAPVTAGIRRPAELLKQAAAGDAKVYQADSKESGSSSEEDKRPAFYRHLMNGVSNMLPFVVGGGILIALSFFFEDQVEGVRTPFGDILMEIGGANAFSLMVPVLAAFIARSIADRPGFAAGMVGGLMASNGDAGFLGGIIAGFLAGYLVVALRKAFAFVPQSLDGIKTILLLPLFGIFSTGLIMYFIVTPLADVQGGLVNWLEGLGTGNIVLLGILLGAMMAIDMGGPINKAAYTFGIAMIAAGNLEPHAAIMAGGMVPPLGIAFATTFFKNKFTKQEKEAGKTNYVLGASFITEGAIPFAASDPGRVIPAIVAGSAVAGGLSMLFGNATEAPHGGAFVILLVNNWPMYIVAILAGAAVTATLLGILKKKVV
ncbi:PTS sugar transporter subunit IIA [Salipaludibacillus agaradhaerens]|uniref:PTS sugar transporter subunit IIA n=1 Tax=Salipaludibacillus agaradhaerens TaxID=76935 RepID=A0A9Q4AZG6_SALAG|nr:PTS fructose transporter subunit IIABC [Salipaludibacillus agaradhaerens]MCR6095390.1 PTS sugar transporter subunit IIA [Salipaludibacillus agaradhaerens]MCR6115052.1 PTS sugar transporter subunit IIA [Salipaludibacillus agaradhaerens]